MKKYRLVLSEDTFLWIKSKEGLVYQSIKCQSFVFPLSDKLQKIGEHLLVLEHLYTIDFTEEELKSPDIRHFVDNLLAIDAGQLIPSTDTKKGDVSLMPVLKIHEQVDYFNEKHKTRCWRQNY